EFRRVLFRSPRASAAIERDLDEVRSDWLSIVDRAIAGEPLPVTGLGTLKFDAGVPAFEPSESVRTAVNARYTGYTDLEISSEVDAEYPLWNTQSDGAPISARPAVDEGTLDVPPDEWPEHALRVDLPVPPPIDEQVEEGSTIGESLPAPPPPADPAAFAPPAH